MSAKRKREAHLHQLVHEEMHASPMKAGVTMRFVCPNDPRIRLRESGRRRVVPEIEHRIVGVEPSCQLLDKCSLLLVVVLVTGVYGKLSGPPAVKQPLRLYE